MTTDITNHLVTFGFQAVYDWQWHTFFKGDCSYWSPEKINSKFDYCKSLWPTPMIWPTLLFRNITVYVPSIQNMVHLHAEIIIIYLWSSLGNITDLFERKEDGIEPASFPSWSEHSTPFCEPMMILSPSPHFHWDISFRYPFLRRCIAQAESWVNSNWKSHNFNS